MIISPMFGFFFVLGPIWFVLVCLVLYFAFSNPEGGLKALGFLCRCVVWFVGAILLLILMIYLQSLFFPIPEMSMEYAKETPKEMIAE